MKSSQIQINLPMSNSLLPLIIQIPSCEMTKLRTENRKGKLHHKFLLWLSGNPTRIHEDVGSIRGLTHELKDLALLWLWCRLAGEAPIWPLAWEFPYTLGAALKKVKKKKQSMLKHPGLQPKAKSQNQSHNMHTRDLHLPTNIQNESSKFQLSYFWATFQSEKSWFHFSISKKFCCDEINHFRFSNFSVYCFPVNRKYHVRYLVWYCLRVICSFSKAIVKACKKHFTQVPVLTQQLQIQLVYMRTWVQSMG